jgi:hypothetical protein
VSSAVICLKRVVPGGARVFHAPPPVTAFFDADFLCWFFFVVGLFCVFF